MPAINPSLLRDVSVVLREAGHSDLVDRLVSWCLSGGRGALALPSGRRGD
jgi:hypothetical protein